MRTGRLRVAAVMVVVVVAGGWVHAPEESDLVTVCHLRGNGDVDQIGVESNAVAAHLDHGDSRPNPLTGDCYPMAAEPFTYDIDVSLTPSPSQLDDSSGLPRPLAAMQDAEGVVSKFVADEVIFAPGNPGELNSFLSTYGGEVVASDEVPEPPAALGVSIGAAERAAREYTIRLDPSGFSLDSVAADAEATGFGGPRTVSSENAMRLLAIMFRERRAGAEISPNFAYDPSGEMLFDTEEHPDGSGVPADSFDWPPTWPSLRFGSDPAGSFSNVLRAWQFVSAHGVAERVEVAIIDSGFWIGGDGVPGTVDPSGTSDFTNGTPAIQYDFNGDDYLAGGPNLVTCTPTPCTWHGNNSASVATANPDNGYGAAGTGGWVADPMLFRTNLTRAEIRRAIKTAAAWGAEVASVSTNGDCNLDCDIWLSGTFQAVVAAQEDGVLVVASAGNTGSNLDQAPSWPCSTPSVGDTPGVFCVGALEPGTTSKAGFSSFGSAVDLYAPTNIATTPNLATMGNTPPLAVGGGTSASAPFVAGIAAMTLAIDPSLTPAQVTSILRSSAWTDSSDSRVPRYANAYQAVLAAADGTLPPDALEPNDTPSTAHNIALPTWPNPASVTPNLTGGQDHDYYRFTVTDYSDVTFDLTFMLGLATVKPILLDTGSGGPPVGPAVTTDHPPGADEGRSYRWNRLTPGTYTVWVQSSDPSLYRVALQAVPNPLSPDKFEVNDTQATAAVPGNGHHFANLHTAADVDHYRFTLSSPLDPVLKVFRFGVEHSDTPLTMRLFKDGVEVGAAQTSTTPSVEVSDNGSYVVQIDAPGTTQYTFGIGEEVGEGLRPGDFPVPFERFWFIDPTDAVERWLVGPDVGFVLPQTDYLLETFEGLRLSGAGLQATLYDYDGTVLAEGEPVGISPDRPAQLLSFESTQEDQNYVVGIERTAEAVPGTTLPLIPYSLSWQEVS